MIRTVFCLNGPDAVNGQNVWLTRHLPMLASRGIEPVVLYLSWSSDIICNYRKNLEEEGVKVVSLQLGRFIEENVIAVAEAVDRLDADAFVPNYSIAGYYAARFLKETGVVTIGILHSDDPYYHDIVDSFVAGSGRWCLSGVVGVSNYLKELVEERTDGALPFLHAPYGAPVPESVAAWSSDSFRMVYSGRLVELQKRVRRVATSMLAAASDCDNLEGILYGVGPEQEWLEKTFLKSDGRVRLGGCLSPEEMQCEMLQGQVFVLLSDFEGMSIALMEAMACGLVPIISRMRSGVSDLVEDGVTGLIVAADDPEAFTRAVKQLSSDRELWASLSKRARNAIVERRYTVDACADAWVEFLKRMDADRPSRKRLVIPPMGEWQMPKRSDRPNGMRVEDRRSGWEFIYGAMVSGRPVFLWGASKAGEVCLDLVKKQKIQVEGFVDSDPNKQGQSLRGYSIALPNKLKNQLMEGIRPFVVISSQYEEEIAEELRRMGLCDMKDFVAG